MIEGNQVRKLVREKLNKEDDRREYNNKRLLRIKKKSKQLKKSFTIIF